MRNHIALFITLFSITLTAQNEIDSIQKLNEIVIESKRIALPFSENSHTIMVMDSLELASLPYSSVDEILQNMNGIDVRRRGIEGMQSDLYIRGGNFEQVLVLIDGVKMDDLQTGHHTMNAMIDPESVERIEVIKGAASRIYGQNAMNGAINIITKKVKTNTASAQFKAGSYNTYGASVGFQKHTENNSTQFHVGKIQSEGYRYNTDFNNWNAFFKTNWNQYEVLATYSERKFGANGFYASPLYKEQYEETQTHLLALKRKFNANNWHFSAQSYWRRNQDMYLLIRNNPDFYQNMHINNRLGISLDADIKTKLGISGIGIDINEGYLSSNNLGDHKRFTATLYAEQRFELGEKLDVTPGVAVTYYDDFGTYAYPGIDIGYKIDSHLKWYVNGGYTSRIPTFTNLYYNSSTEQGNPDLKPEKAFTAETGFYFSQKRLLANVSGFYRNASDLIDWTKENLIDKWQASNFNQVETKGIETSFKYGFKMNEFRQFLTVGYTFLDEKIIDQEVAYSRYELNSFRNQITAHFNSSFIKNIRQTISYRYVERKTGTAYHVFDAGINAKVNAWDFSVLFNNLFDTEYTETNLVPMPQFNMMGMISYRF